MAKKQSGEKHKSRLMLLDYKDALHAARSENDRFPQHVAHTPLRHER
jgi:hypothetical protein